MQNFNGSKFYIKSVEKYGKSYFQHYQNLYQNKKYELQMEKPNSNCF